MSEESVAKPSPSSPVQTRRFRAGATIVLALAVGIIVWLVLRDNGGSSSHPSTITAASAGQIRTLAASVDHPVFWVGEKQGYTYELRRESDGTIIIRYLPHGVKLGTPKPYLSVATYPFPGAFAALKGVAKHKGTVSLSVPNGGIGTFPLSYPKSVHVAYPGVDYQLEVFDPSAGKAASLVATGQLLSVGGLKRGSAVAPKPTAITVTGLKSVAASVGHPIYWLGPRTRSTYELTRSPSGKIIIRYLPRGAKVGIQKPYTAVATYPFPRAFPAIQALAKQPNTAELKLPGGGLGVINNAYPKSIHLAYPSSSYQIEVFDPSPTRVRKLVTSGQVRTIG
jgi:hypothetical protein